MNANRGFRQTEIGLIPVEWEVVMLGNSDVCDVVMGQSPPSETYNDEGMGLPFFQGKADFGFRHPVPKIWCTASQRKALPGDILLSVRAPVGDVNIATTQSCIGRGLAAIRAKSKADSEFLFYSLMKEKDTLDSLGTGATFRAINKDTVLSFKLSLPPPSEQRAIASVLSTIQAAVEAQQKLIATLRELKQATMAKLFREGLRGEPLKVTKIGEVPESWEVVELHDVVDVKSGKRLPKGLALVDSKSSYPYIRIVDMKNNSVNLRDIKYLLPEIRQRIQKYIVTSEDVYISIAGTTGLVGIVPKVLDGANLTENAARLVIRDETRIGKQYLMYSLASDIGQAQVKTLTTQTSQPKLALSRIETIQIGLPLPDEQRGIAHVLRIVDDRTTDAEKKRDALQALFKAMLHQLMTAQLRVTDVDLPELNGEERGSLVIETDSNATRSA